MEQSLEVLHKEIDLIQNCIKKYDDRSLLIKGWSIALISLICGLSSSSLLIFNAKAIPISLYLLLIVNALFHIVDTHNSQKKWLYTLLYEWTIKNREFDDNPWKHVYNLDYTRFKDRLNEFSSSRFSTTIYMVTWGFIISLMVFHTISGFQNSKEEKNQINNTLKMQSK